MSKRIQTHAARARLEDGGAVAIPYWTLDSGKPGPCLLLVAAQHGNEVQGTEIIRRFLEIARRSLKAGAVIAIPVANPLAFHERRPHYGMQPEEPYGAGLSRNMNTRWPGDPKGNNAQRLCWALHRCFAGRATHLLDIHCWEKDLAPALLCWPSPEGKALAARMGCRFVRVMDISGTVFKGMLHYPFTSKGLTYECAGQYDIKETEVLRGLRLALNFARTIGLLPGKVVRGEGPVLFSDETTYVDVKAPMSGLFVKREYDLCGFVRKGAALGHILEDATLKTRIIRAPVSGWLKQYGICRSNADVALPQMHPLVSPGDVLARIVCPCRKDQNHQTVARWR